MTRMTAFLGAALCLMAATLPRTGAASPVSDATAVENSLAGRLATADLTDEAGRHIDLSNLAGRIVFIDFWADWCLSCLEEMPRLQAISTSMAGESQSGFLAVHFGRWDGRPASHAAFMASRGAFYPTLIDAHTHFTTSYNWLPFVNSLPKTILFDRSGKIFRRYSQSELGEVAADIRRLAAAKPAHE